ncbi:hypothetical protein CY35_01G167700 [Sphagnum magellanicum]|nr:hypothetical protein CY35_01G167700 [Sphagnum magellanicum]
MWRCLRIWIPPPAWSRLQAGIVVDRYAGTYKLVIVGEVTKQEGGGKREQKESSDRLCVRLRFSILELPRNASELLGPLHVVSDQPFPHFGRFCHQIRSVCCSVVCEGVMYCLTSRPYQLHAFHVESEEWSRSRVALPAEIRGPRSLAGRPGHLFLVGAYLHNQHDKSSNIGIWELDQETLRWSVVDILLEATLCNHGRSKIPASPWHRSKT